MGNMDNLVLIGMPSSGKSTAGVLLAKRIGYGFIDCDLIIQGEEGKKLSEIIEDKGVDGFIGIEERVNAGIMATHCVIATGGSVVYSDRAMRHLKEIGTVVYLELGPEEVERRTIVQALQKYNNNLSRAAAALKIARNTVRKYLEEA